MARHIYGASFLAHPGRQYRLLMFATTRSLSKTKRNLNTRKLVKKTKIVL